MLETAELKLNQSGNTTELLEKFAELQKIERIDVGDPEKYFVAVPSGKTIKNLTDDLEKYLPAPRQRRGTANIDDVDSFIQHANRFKDGELAVFCDRNKSNFTAVYDYHATGGPGDNTQRHGHHRAILGLRLHKLWKKWLSGSGTSKENLKTSEEFSNFLEVSINDIGDINTIADAQKQSFAELERLIGGKIATASQMLELARDLEINVESRVKTSNKLASGEKRIIFETSHKNANGEELYVPNLFIINIPMFEGAAPQPFACRLFYRIIGGNIQWAYELYNPDQSIEIAIETIAQTIRTETGLPVLYGQPE